MCQLDNIMDKRDIIHKLAKRHKVKKVFVFGSCARKEENSASDIDFLMEFEHDASFRDNIEFFLGSNSHVQYSKRGRAVNRCLQSAQLWQPFLL